MNALPRRRLIQALKVMRQSRCAYGASGRCDCKFLLKTDLEQEPDMFGHRKMRGGEHTGCCELGNVINILETMNDIEYENMVRIGGHHLMGDF